MSPEPIDHARATAQAFYTNWGKHGDALDGMALLYLDCLIDVVLATTPMTKYQLSSALKPMLPKSNFGTINRILNMRFGESDGKPLKPYSGANGQGY